MSIRLIVMRLIDMHKMHPQQDNSKVCALCGQPVGIYPSGQVGLKANPTMEIVCSVCAAKDFDPAKDHDTLVGSIETIVQETLDSFEVKKA